VTAGELRIDAVIVACAISAGIHAALAPEHFQETTGAGVGFVASAVLLAALAVVLTRRPSDAAFAATALVFAALIGSYVLAVTTGIPGIHPDVDPVEGLAVATKAVEAAGLALAAWGLRLAPLHLNLTNPKGTLT
jgi:drug/metabolite transporter (DMT)-like permease